MEAVLHFFIDQFSHLMDISLTVSIVILAVIGIRQLLKRAPKIFAYALWGIVLLRLLVPISIESPVSIVPDQTAFSSVMELNEVLPEIEFETPQDRAHNEWIRENTPADEPFTQISRSFNAEIYLTLAWLIGMLVMMVTSAVSYGKLRKRVRVCVPFRKGIYIADDIDTPFVMGIFRPVIYLPGTLEDKERKYIITHEQHHIHRGDHIFKSLAFLALTIHWFNPLVWVAFVLAGRDMEMSCDEAVIRKLGEDVRADYSASLLNLATGHRLFAGTPLAFGEVNPTGRVRNLARWKKPAFWVVVICSVLCVVLAVCLLTDPEIVKPMELLQETAQTIKVVLHNEPLPDGYFESRDDKGNLIFTDGINTVGGVVCYSIPEGIYNPDDHIEVLLYKMGIPDYMDADLYFRGGMTSGDNGWLAEFESEVPEGEEPSVYRRHHFYLMEGMVYDIWFDMTQVEYEKTEEIRVCINLPAGKPAELKDWDVSIKPDRVSRTGATALFVYSGSIPGEEDAELIYGDFLILDKWVGGKWVPVEELQGYEYFVGDSSYPVADGYGMAHEWEDRFGELPDGTYRMGKQVTLVRQDGSRESRMVYGEFMLPDSIRTGLIPMEELPEVYGAEQAMIDGCFVSENGTARENKELFQSFAENARNGMPGVIRHYNCGYTDSFHWSVSDLRFDGNVYTLTTDEHTYTFRYLKHFTGEKAWEAADHDAFEFYVLVNDETVTLEDIYSGKLDMSDWKNPAHWTVYADLIYLPEQPRLPMNPAQAVLEFEGQPLVTTTDFDRLEKIWILFNEAEFLGYEPKTHSVGVGLNLILTSERGETMTIELDPDSDICRINGEFVFYGAPEEPDYIEKLWYYLGLEAWPDIVYEKCSNALRP